MKTMIDGFDIFPYIHSFLHIWNRELEPDGEFSWRIITHKNDPSMLAIVFSTQYKGEHSPQPMYSEDEQEWDNLLSQLEADEYVRFNRERFYIDRFFRAVMPTQIVIIKRIEGSLWTPLSAQKDISATKLKAILRDEDIESCRRGINPVEATP